MNPTDTKIVFEIMIEASIKDVWYGVTRRINKWWPESFRMGADAIMHFEAAVGGRLYESTITGGLLWGVVNNIQEPTLLQWAGALFPEYGGPAFHFSTIKLEPDGENKTLLYFNSALIGEVTEGGLREMQKGWQYLYGDCLKAWLEEREEPPWDG